jgi:PleD family two-component response regulator
MLSSESPKIPLRHFDYDCIRGKFMLIAKVLLVDDDEIVRHTLSEALTDNGFVRLCRANVREALKLISKGQYDVLLTCRHSGRC